MASARIQRMSKSSQQKPPSKAPSSNTNDVPDEIQCKICKKRYEDAKLLPCLHTFCKACLEKSLEKYGGVLYCPVCPGEVGSTFTDVDKLTNNFMVSNLLQAIDLKRGGISKQCESCDENNLASSRCYQCTDFLCDNCVEAHRRVRYTKQHRVVSVKTLSADALVRTTGCPSHVHETVKMFCKQCNEPVCRSCILDEHDDHALVSLKEAIDVAKPKLNTLLVAARAKIPLLQRKLKEVHTAKGNLEAKVDDVIKDIQATSARVLMAVKRREKYLYKILRRTHDKKSDELEGREAALQNELAQVLDSCEFAEQLVEEENDVNVLHVSEVTCARLRSLGGEEIAPVPEIHEDEIEYTVEEKPILDELKIYGKVMSREEKAKKMEDKERESRKEKRGRNNNAKEEGKEGNGKQSEETKVDKDKKTATVQRKESWLETLANPRALLRRLSFGGDESDGKIRPGQQSGSKGQQSGSKDQEAPKETSKPPAEPSSKQPDEDGTEPSSPKQQRTGEPSKEQDQGENGAENSQRKRGDSVSRQSEKAEEKDKKENEHLSSPSTTKSQLTQSEATKNDPTTVVTQTVGEPKSPRKDNEQPATSTDEGDYATIQTSHSILKHTSSQDTVGTEEEPSNSGQAWTLPAGSRPSGAHSLSYLPTLKILTKNRRGRPREVEIQLESPDNSIVSAQILDHKNGTYTIFYCPTTPGEHNLFVNVGGKHIKHGKKVLNFYGKFEGMGAEELFLTRRALSCIRWQATPGFLEIINKKIKANPDF